MKLKDQVITREQAERLKELTVAQDSFLVYFTATSHAGICQRGGMNSSRFVWQITGQPYEAEDIQTVAAFTVAELGIMLPEWLHTRGKEYRLIQWHNVPEQYEEKGRDPDLDDEYCEEWRIAYRHNHKQAGEIGENMRAPTEAQVRAAMLIHLLESNLVKVEEVNNRLKQ
jgi:hypothetical protein